LNLGGTLISDFRFPIFDWGGISLSLSFIRVGAVYPSTGWRVTPFGRLRGSAFAWRFPISNFLFPVFDF
jgi:hypothetical protein